MSTPTAAAGGGAASAAAESAANLAIRAAEKAAAEEAAAEKASLKSKITELETLIVILRAAYNEFERQRQEAFDNHIAAQAAFNKAKFAAEKAAAKAAADETRHKLLAITDAAARAKVKFLTAVQEIAWCKLLIANSALDEAITDATSAAGLLDEAAEKFAAEERAAEERAAEELAAAEEAAKKFAAETETWEAAAEEALRAAEEAAAEEALRTAGLLY
jgi:hypothetical protein